MESFVKITADDVPVVKLALRKGYDQHIIAAYFRENQGRISEINTGKRFASVPMAAHLPPDFPPR
jgi:hypothetical protein